MKTRVKLPSALENVLSWSSLLAIEGLFESGFGNQRWSRGLGVLERDCFLPLLAKPTLVAGRPLVYLSTKKWLKICLSGCVIMWVRILVMLFKLLEVRTILQFEVWGHLRHCG